MRMAEVQAKSKRVLSEVLKSNDLKEAGEADLEGLRKRLTEEMGIQVEPNTTPLALTGQRALLEPYGAEIIDEQQQIQGQHQTDRLKALDKELQRLTDQVSSSRKSVAILVSHYGIPYFFGNSTYQFGAIESRQLDRLVTAKTEAEIALRRLEQNPERDAAATLEAKCLLEATTEVLSEHRSHTLDLSMQQHNFQAAVAEYELAKGLLEEQKLKLLRGRAEAKIPMSFSVHWMP